MIGAIERMARERGGETCFWFVDDEGAAAARLGAPLQAESGCADAEPAAFSWDDVRLLAVATGSLLADRGVARGDVVAIDAPNCAAYPIVLLAAAYGGFALATLNNRLVEAEKRARLGALEASGMRIAAEFDEEALSRLLSDARAALADEAGRVSAEDDARALQAAAELDEGAPAVIMFTSGTTGVSKAAVLTWANLCGSARAANAAFGRAGERRAAVGDGAASGVGLRPMLWQAALPLYHVGGLQIVVRSLLAGRPFLLYRRFDARRVLADAARLGATHVSVVDKTLRDLLDAATERGEAASALRAYDCVLLGGAAANPRTLKRAAAAGVRTYASYGMTETSSAIAAALVGEGRGAAAPALELLPGYRVRIVDPDADGFGSLAVAGPGVIARYANAPCERTEDGFFLTGDAAAIADGALVLRERTGDMFVSGGENVYPAQVVAELLAVPGIADAHVYGAPDDAWGRRPVAFVERDRSDAGASPLLARHVRAHCARRLSRISRPDRVIALEAFPRSGIGKTDRRALERIDAMRLDVVDVRLRRATLPFARPFRTARGTLTERAALFVEVRDGAGRAGVGECVAFETDWYLPETLAEDERVIRDVLAPFVLDEAFARPEDAYAAFAALPEAAPYPMARAAVENALWDLFGKVAREPLWRLIGGVCDTPSAPHVPVGAVVGIGSRKETLAQARALAGAGYRRVKLKVAPGRGDVERVRAVREALPDLAVSLDANQSFAEDDLPELRELDALGATWIEEPLAFAGAEADQRDPAAAQARFSRLARLQRELATPVCLDESYFTIDEARAALAHPELRCFCVKIAKLGGVTGALSFAHEALAAGTRVWMGGMYDTGVSKRLHAAFETIPGIDDPGDLGSVSRYFGRDVAVPPYEPADGAVSLNDAAHPFGVGCELR